MRRAVYGYVVLAVAGLLGLFVLPDGGLGVVLCKVAVGYLASVAVLVGVSVHRPRSRVPWWLFALGVFGNATGILVEYVVFTLDPYAVLPTPADAFYLSFQPAVVAGLVLLARDRGNRRDAAALIDTVVITTSLGLLSWVYLIHPAGTDTTLGLDGRLLNIAYPVGDLIMLATMTRLLLGARARSFALSGVSAAIGLFLVGDVIWAVANLAGWHVDGLSYHSLASLFEIAYLAFGAAALHRSMTEVGEESLQPSSGLGRARLTLLGVTTLLAPGLLGVQALTGRVTDGVAIALGASALFLLVVARLAQLLRRLEQQSAQLRELTRIDELTALPNRRAWAAELPSALERARRAAQPLCVAMIDLDHFKRFNDEFGHPAGDRLLRGAAAAWRECLRDGDLLARYGGEEFILLLPSADDRDGAEILGRLREVTPLGQTFSAGLARWDGVETSEELIARADRALYRAKGAGRDRVEFDGDPTPAPAALPTPAG